MSRIIFGAFLLFFWPIAVFSQQIQWRPSLEAAVAESEAGGKPVLLHFSANWCRPCIDVTRFVLADTMVIRIANQETVPFLIDTDTRPDLVKKYSITNLPTDVLIATGDTVVLKRTSPNESKMWVDMLEKGVAAAKAVKTNGSAHYDPIAELNQKWEQTNQPPEGLPDKFKINNFHMQQNMKLASNLKSGDAPAIQLTEEESVSSATLAPATKFYARSETTGHETKTPESAMGTANAGSGSIRFSNPYMNSNSKVDRPALVVREVTSNQSENLPAACLDGLCPVTVLDEGYWVAGKPEIGCVHRGRTYLFQTVEKRERFLSAPDRWSPLFAGYDPVAFADGGKLIEGQRGFGIFMKTDDHQQVVLFANLANQAEFKATSAKYMDAIRLATVEADKRPDGIRR